MKLRRHPALLVGVAFLVCAVIVIPVSWNSGSEDPGIAGCKQMQAEADRKRDGRPAQIDSTDDYQDLRYNFEKSRHDTLRTSGVGFVDLALGMSAMPTMDIEQRQGRSLALLAVYSALIKACGQYDVVLPTLESFESI